MKPELKPVEDQVMVITGASSGIGLTTARMATQRGAKVVLAARSGAALAQLADELTRSGGRAIHVVADVSKPEDVRAIAQAARDRFGGFDTWVNNAGIGIYGKIAENSVDDMRKLFDTNFWGVVYGSMEAVAFLRDHGGALINIGSNVSDQAVPLLGIYSASKHAVKGFTDSLRMELHADDAPVSVTLIKPGPIDTPFPLNARNYLTSEPRHVPPVYSPETVARAILRAAESPVREVFIGAGGKMNVMLGHYLPHLTTKVMLERTPSGKPPRQLSALDRPSEHLAERGDYNGHVAKSSVYTQASLHPLLAGAALLGAGLAATALWRGTRRN